MSKRYIGIDPGKSGAIGVIDRDDSGMIIHSECMLFPIAGDELDLYTIKNKIRSLVDIRFEHSNSIIACIEKVSAMPGQGVVSMFTFGYNVGVIHGILASFDIPRYLVTPQKWKKEILAGTDRTKEASIEYILRTLPGINLKVTERSRTYNHNMSDALCIALYASNHY